MSKIVETNKNLLQDALLEFNAMKEEAIKVAKNRLTATMPDVFEKFIKEELEKSIAEEGIASTEDTMIDDQESSVMDTMKDGQEAVSENEDHSEEMGEELEDDELTAKAIEEALKEIEGMGDGEGHDEELEEHDLSFQVNFNDDKLEIKDVTSGGQEFEDVEFELEMDDEMGDDSMEDSIDGEELESLDTDSLGDDSLGDDSMGGEEDMGDDSMGDSIEDIDLDSLEDEEEVEESLSHTITHDNSKGAGSHNHTNQEKAKRLRPAMQESALKKDVNKLLKENEELRSINKDFKEALTKYKTQLYEMAVFNANLSHVNNLFVEHTTTVDEKKEILNKFKSVSTIDESKNVYSGFVKTLTESKSNKKTIEEMIEKPSNGDSGSKTLNESLVKDNNDGIKAIKKIMSYIEKRK